MEKMIVFDFYCVDCDEQIPENKEIHLDTPHGIETLCEKCAEARYDRAHP